MKEGRKPHTRVFPCPHTVWEAQPSAAPSLTLARMVLGSPLAPLLPGEPRGMGLEEAGGCPDPGKTRGRSRVCPVGQKAVLHDHCDF